MSLCINVSEWVGIFQRHHQSPLKSFYLDARVSAITSSAGLFTYKRWISFVPGDWSHVSNSQLPDECFSFSFPFISFPASQISHLKPRKIQYLICEVCCQAEWKVVEATHNCYRQKDNCRNLGALSERMACLCWFRFKSSLILYTLLAVPFL